MEFYPVAQQALKRPAAEAGLINQVQQTNGNTIAAPAPSDSCQQSNVVLYLCYKILSAFDRLSGDAVTRES